MANVETENEIRFESIEILSKTRSQVENRVKMVRSLLKDGEIKAEALKKVRTLYTDARTEVNAGLDRLLIEIEITGSFGSTEPYERVAERAAKHTTEFIATSDELILGKDRGSVEASLEMADSMVKALVDVWKTLRGEKSERRRLLIKRIESLKWEEFDQIK